MVHFVGLDVSVKETSVCVVDDAGKVVLEQKVPTEPDAIIALLTSLGATYGRIGIEAGPLSQWLVNALTAAELPVICVETRHMKALLSNAPDGYFSVRDQTPVQSADGVAVRKLARRRRNTLLGASHGVMARQFSMTPLARDPSRRSTKPVMPAMHLVGPYLPEALIAATPVMNSVSPSDLSSSGPSARYISRACSYIVATILWPLPRSASNSGNM